MVITKKKKNEKKKQKKKLQWYIDKYFIEISYVSSYFQKHIQVLGIENDCIFH